MASYGGGVGVAGGGYGGGVSYPGHGGNYYGSPGGNYYLPDRVPYGITGPLVIPYNNDVHKRYLHGHKKNVHDARRLSHGGNYYKDNGAYLDNTKGQYYNNQYNNKGHGVQYQ